MSNASAADTKAKAFRRSRSGAATRSSRPADDGGKGRAAGRVTAVTSGNTSAPRRVTARGAATRDRIVSSAADLMYIRGVNAVTLDDVRAATGTSKSQLYKHFPAGKTDLIRAVVELRAEQILAREEERLQRLKSMSGLRRWRDALMQAASLRGGAYGCALGSLAIEVSDQDEQARSSLATHFAAWEALLAAGLHRMKDNGTLAATADPDALAVGLMAALQGGYLLAKADHNVAAMATSLDMALAHIESLTVKPGEAQPVRRRAH
jgi:TetR/AcrR family transcriptional regulator, transcriptional repressor for nem operon